MPPLGRGTSSSIPPPAASSSCMPPESSAAEVAAELSGGMHDDEAAGGGIDDEVPRPSGGIDQAGEQPDRLGVRVSLAVDLLRPAIADAVVAPGALGGERRLLQHQ